MGQAAGRRGREERQHGGEGGIDDLTEETTLDEAGVKGGPAAHAPVPALHAVGDVRRAALPAGGIGQLWPIVWDKRGRGRGQQRRQRTLSCLWVTLAGSST